MPCKGNDYDEKCMTALGKKQVPYNWTERTIFRQSLAMELVSDRELVVHCEYHLEATVDSDMGLAVLQMCIVIRQTAILCIYVVAAPLHIGNDRKFVPAQILCDHLYLATVLLTLWLQTRAVVWMIWRAAVNYISTRIR
jgi:hypothetical protein